MYGFRLVSDPRPKQSSGDWEMPKWTALLAVLVCFCVEFCWSKLVSLRLCVSVWFWFGFSWFRCVCVFHVVLGWSRTVSLRLFGSVWFWAGLGKKLPARELQSEEDMKQLAFDMQAMMNSEGDQIAKMAQGAESNRNEGENESILREPLHLQGKFDLQKGKVAYLWKRHLRQNPESREKYAGAGKDYEKKREIPAQWNQDEWKLTKVALTNHGRQTSNEI